LAIRLFLTVCAAVAALGAVWAEKASKADRSKVEAYQPHGINVGVNLGKPAGAGVLEHVHVHLVPRWNGDTNFMPVLADTRVIVQSLDTLYGLLKERLPPERGA